MIPFPRDSNLEANSKALESAGVSSNEPENDETQGNEEPFAKRRKMQPLSSAVLPADLSQTILELQANILELKQEREIDWVNIHRLFNFLNGKCELLQRQLELQREEYHSYRLKAASTNVNAGSCSQHTTSRLTPVATSLFPSHPLTDNSTFVTLGSSNTSDIGEEYNESEWTFDDQSESQRAAMSMARVRWTAQHIQTPVVVAHFPPLQINISNPANEEFSYSFLKVMLENFPAANDKKQIKYHSYRFLDAEYEPLLPTEPGKHGAQLSILPPESNAIGFPVFIKTAENDYVYFGNYRTPQAPSELTDEEMQSIPNWLKEHWAKHLALTHIAFTLIECQDPSLIVAICDHHVVENIWIYELLEAGREEEAISASNVLRAFNTPSKSATADSPSLRLSYEYLECIDYDEVFYEYLVDRKYSSYH